MGRKVAERLNQTIATGNQAFVYLTQLTGNEMSATVSATGGKITFWLEYGKAGDDFSALPFSSSVATVADGESGGLFVKIAAASQIARVVIDNASGVSVDVVCDAGVK